MKKLILMLAMLFCVLPAHAQSRFLVGADGGNSFGNYFIGPSVGLEFPFLHRFEIDNYGSYFPYESHTGLGSGHSYGLSTQFSSLINKTSGVYAGLSTSGYTVTKAAKAESFIHAGFEYHHSMFDSPARFFFGYVGEIVSKISKNGNEPNDLSGGEFAYDVRMGCKSSMCFRTSLKITIAHIRNQGNQDCDGSLGVYIPSCKRTDTVSGGTEVTFFLEFPRRHGHEDDQL